MNQLAIIFDRRPTWTDVVFYAIWAGLFGFLLHPCYNYVAWEWVPVRAVCAALAALIYSGMAMICVGIFLWA